MTDNTKTDLTVARENEHAAKAQQQRATQEEKRRNSLPRFLLIRSGFWGAWVFPVCTATVTCVTPYENGHNPEFYFWLLLTGILTCVAGVHATKRKKMAKDDINTIRYEMSEYVKDPNYVLDLSRVRNFPRMTSILVRHITKTNPGVFDRFIANPQSISDNEAMQDIIIGYLDKHSDDAPKILDALHKLQQSMPNNNDGQCGLGDDDQQIMEIENDVLPVSYELRRRLERYARRVAGPTKRR